MPVSGSPLSHISTSPRGDELAGHAVPADLGPDDTEQDEVVDRRRALRQIRAVDLVGVQIPRAESDRRAVGSGR